MRTQKGSKFIAVRYLDKDNNSTDNADLAFKTVITEYDEDGNLTLVRMSLDPSKGCIFNFCC